MKQMRIFGEVQPWLPIKIGWFIDELEKDEDFEVIISSPGGDAFAGMSAYHLLKEYKPQVRILGHASSAASIISLCAGEGRLLAAEGSLSLLHGASALSHGNADKQRKVAAELDKITESAKKIYMSRFNGTDKQLDAILKEDTFHDTEALLKWGLIDKVMEDKEEEPIDADLLEEANIWMSDIKNILETPNSYVANYVTMLGKTPQRPTEETNIINNKNEDDAMSQDATMQAKYQEEFAARVQLAADLKVRDTEIADVKAKLQTLQDNVATMTAEKTDIENKHTSTVSELDALKATMADVEKQKAENEIEAFLNANDKKILPAMKDSFKMMLQTSLQAGAEQFQAAKDSIEKMPENPLFGKSDNSDRADSDGASMTVSEVKKMNWDAVDFSTKEGDAMLTNAINILMKADAELTSEQAENQLLGGQ